MSWVYAAVTAVTVAGTAMAGDAAKGGLRGAKGTLKKGKAEALGYLQPYADIGAAAAPDLTSLVMDPTKQLDFIQNNPFFGALAEKAKQDVFGNKAARGKVGSGGTAEALQNSIVLLGNQLLGEQINREQNLVTTGQQAAANQAQIAQNTAANIAKLKEQGGQIGASTVSGITDAISSGISGKAGIKTV